jgi:Flp pilus assembly protein TadD
MTPHVMISFSSKNVPVVEKILRRIEDAGLPCWVSYRDIKQGQNYQGSITAAIRDASAVVFVLCKEFNLSEETKRELSLASSFKKPMVPIRTEAFTFSDELVYVLATVQYIDAFPDFDAALSRMIVRLKEIVATATPPVVDAAPSLLPAAAAVGVSSAADKYTETARQVYADGIVTPAERVKLDTARELLEIPADMAAQIEQQFARAVTAPAPRSDVRYRPAQVSAEKWDGYWMVNVSDGVHRTWDDHIRFGYVGAGQGAGYREALLKLSPGDRIFAYFKGSGYVGFGEVTAAAVMIRDFQLPDGTALLSAGLRAPLAGEHPDDPDRCEWAAAVRWIKTLPRHAAIKFPGIFSSQHAVCKLRDEKTLAVLRTEFEVSTAIPIATPMQTPTFVPRSPAQPPVVPAAARRPPSVALDAVPQAAPAIEAAAHDEEDANPSPEAESRLERLAYLVGCYAGSLTDSAGKILASVIAVLVVAAAYFHSGDKAAPQAPTHVAPRESTPTESPPRISANQRFEVALARADVRSAGIDAIPIVQASPLLDQLAGSMASSDTQTASAITSRLAALPKVERGARATARKANDRGIAALRANDNAAAVASLRDAVRADPGDVEVIDNLGYAYNLSGDLEAAEFWARVALAVSPTRSSAWLNLGIAGGQQGDESMALGALLLAHKYSGRPDRTINAVQELKDRGNSTPEMRSAAARALERLVP